MTQHKVKSVSTIGRPRAFAQRTPTLRAPSPVDKTEIYYPFETPSIVGQSTLHLNYFILIHTALACAFEGRSDVFYASDMFWYPVEGDSKETVAPDGMVVFGPPSTPPRKSYRQWEEGDIPPFAVFEVISESNSREHIEDKIDFYNRHGVEEVYVLAQEKAGPWNITRYLREIESIAEALSIDVETARLWAKS